MYSHFSVILLCFSSVNCISSMIENLDYNKLSQIFSDNTIIKEWDTAMDQHIFYTENRSTTTINVRHAVDAFMAKAGNHNVTEFKRIRNIIKTAYQCTLAKYANLTAYLTVQDVRTLIGNITKTVDMMRSDGLSYDPRSLFEDQSFLKYFPRVSEQQYHFNFDLRFRGRKIQLLGDHDFESTPSKQWQNVWADMIKKALGLKIKYKIFPDVIEKKFTNKFDLPDVYALNEIDCVLNEVIQLFDNFILKKCVQHGGSFLTNFQSLKQGVNNDVIQLTNYIDQKIAARSLDWALYKDYSIPGPGTSQAVNEIRASGVFVENVKFEISGLKMDLPNANDQTKIYAHNVDKFKSEAILEFTETRPNVDNVIEVCKVSFRDAESWLVDQHTPSRDTIREIFAD